MNKAQEIHVQAMAHKIEGHAQAIVLRMQALQRNSLADMPIELIQANFADSLYYAEVIGKVYAEMLPQLPRGTGYTWQVYLERADDDEPKKPLGTIQADTMSRAIEEAAAYYEYPQHDIIVERVITNEKKEGQS
jgi:hypothetical protein